MTFLTNEYRVLISNIYFLFFLPTENLKNQSLLITQKQKNHMYVTVHLAGKKVDWLGASIFFLYSYSDIQGTCKYIKFGLGPLYTYAPEWTSQFQHRSMYLSFFYILMNRVFKNNR